jgi:hypothetical protein
VSSSEVSIIRQYAIPVTSVLLIGYNRPENIVQRIKELEKNVIENLYISLDKCLDPLIAKEVLTAAEESVTKSSLSKNTTIWRQDRNLGLSNHICWAIKKVLEDKSELIVIEDDIRISNDFVSQMSDCYSEHSGEKDLGTVGGFSGVPIIYDTMKNYWRQSRYFSAWGWMIGRETWSLYEQFLPQGDLEAQLSNSQNWALLSPIQRTTWLQRFDKVRNNPSLTWDYQMQYMTFKYDLKHILPLFRICENVGFHDPRSTNTVNRKPRWMQDDKIYERAFSEAELPRVFDEFLNHVDAFTISGDSNLRKKINNLRKKIS